MSPRRNRAFYLAICARTAAIAVSRLDRPRGSIFFSTRRTIPALPLGTDGQRSARESAENDVRVSLLDAKKQEQLSEKDFPYVVRRKTQKPCILANMTIAVTVPYIDKNEARSSNEISLSNSILRIAVEYEPLSTRTVIKNR